jgi:predicted PurR-regulated permease PerM
VTIAPDRPAREGDATTAMPARERFRTFVYATLLAVAIGWVLYVGRGIFVPIVFSVLVVYVIRGLADVLARLPGVGPRLPKPLRYTVSTLAIGWALTAIASLVAASLSNVTSLAPQYADSLLTAIQELATRLGIETTPTWDTLKRDLLAQVNAQRLIGSTVVSVGAILSTLVVVLLYVVFLLIEERSFAAKLAGISRDPERVAHLRRIIGSINGRVGTYLALKTVVSAVLGLLSWAILAFFGVEFAPFWGVLIGLLNFIPYFGSVLGVVLPAAFATMQFVDVGQVLVVVLALSAAQFVIGFFLDPYLMANSLNLSPFVILVSLAVWGALWGIAGAFLAVPLTACMALVFAEFEATRPLAVLLSQDGRI